MLARLICAFRNHAWNGSNWIFVYDGHPIRVCTRCGCFGYVLDN